MILQKTYKQKKGVGMWCLEVIKKMNNNVVCSVCKKEFNLDEKERPCSKKTIPTSCTKKKAQPQS